MVLEGNEFEKKFDGGEAIIDVDDKGSVKVSVSFNKEVEGLAKVSSVNSVETDIFKIAAKIAASTQTTWDDQAVEGLKKLLGVA